MSERDQVSRRRFLSGLSGLGLLAGPLVAARTGEAQVSPAAPKNLRVGSGGPVTGKAVLTQNDFTYLGCFRMPGSPGGLDSTWGYALTHRYVNGQLRFLAGGWLPNYGLQLYEVTAPSGLGQTPVGAPTAPFARKWGAFGLAPATSGLNGIYWDEPDKRLYWAGGHPYNTDAPRAPAVGYSLLNDATGAVQNLGPWGFADRSTKMVNAGVTAVPKWFADGYCQGRRLAAGFGGYQSVMSIGPVSMGPALTAFNPAQMAAAAAQSAVPHTALLGYPLGSSSGLYSNPWRCERDTDYRSEYSGDWPAKDGVGYFTWSDWLQAGCWEDTPTKSALMFFPTISGGRVYYQTSQLQAERARHVWYAYDPADLARVAQGSKDQWAIQAKGRWDVRYPGIAYPMPGPNSFAERGTTGATFDTLTSTLFVSVRFGVDGDGLIPNIVHAYKVS